MELQAMFNNPELEGQSPDTRFNSYCSKSFKLKGYKTGMVGKVGPRCTK